MTTTTTAGDPADGTDQPPAPTRVTRFIARLHATHRSNMTADLSAARRWHPGKVDVRVASLVFADDDPATADEYPVWAQMAKLWVLWHSASAKSQPGTHGVGIGGWAKQLRAKDEHFAGRLLARLVAANDATVLDGALSALASARTPNPPDWRAVIRELTDWRDPSQRNSVQLTWAHDFHLIGDSKPKR